MNQENVGSKLTVKLNQHSMMIHFQADQRGSVPICLRASEVKPKLDRFIVKKLGKENIPREWIQSEHLNGKDVALRYRMTIMHNKHTVIPSYRIPKIFYGNMGIRNDEEKRNAVWFDGLELTILCFVPELMKKIKVCIAEFFIVTNFGTMQSKGFGSFTVTEVNGKEVNVDVAKALKLHYGAEKCFKIPVNQGRNNSETKTELFDTIKQVYSVMKSGWRRPYERSYIYQYMHDKPRDIGNEKAFMKKKNVSPNVMTDRTRVMFEQRKNYLWTEQPDNQYYYVRALLGLGEQLRYKASLQGGWETIQISHVKNESGDIYQKGDEKKIERVPSPIFFKVIHGDIYFVAGRIPERFYEPNENKRYFSFFNKRTRRKCVLPVPEKSIFDIDDFIKSFVDHYNNVFLSKVKRDRLTDAKTYSIITCSEVQP